MSCTATEVTLVLCVLQSRWARSKSRERLRRKSPGRHDRDSTDYAADLSSDHSSPSTQSPRHRQHTVTGKDNINILTPNKHFLLCNSIIKKNKKQKQAKKKSKKTCKKIILLLLYRVKSLWKWKFFKIEF